MQPITLFGDAAGAWRKNTCAYGIVFDCGGQLCTPERFAACLDRLRRRGPDDVGIWPNSVVRLGHRRLAVVDLSPSGHQPMVSADGRLVFASPSESHRAAAGQLCGSDGENDATCIIYAVVRLTSVTRERIGNPGITH